MQGQRSATGSLHDPINLSFGSTSGNIGMEQQSRWNNLRDPAESTLSDYRNTPRGAVAFMGTGRLEARNSDDMRRGAVAFMGTGRQEAQNSDDTRRGAVAFMDTGRQEARNSDDTRRGAVAFMCTGRQEARNSEDTRRGAVAFMGTSRQEARNSDDRNAPRGAVAFMGTGRQEARNSDDTPHGVVAFMGTGRPEARNSDNRNTPRGAVAYLGTDRQEARNLSRWSIGESSSGNPLNPNNHDEQMAPTGWWSSISTSGGSDPRQDSQLYEPSVVASRNSVNLSLNINQIPSEPSFVRSSTNGATSKSHNINIGQLDRVGGDPMDCSNSSKSGMLEHRLFPSSSGSEPFASSLGSGGFLVEDDDGRSGCAMDGRRMSCKRKTIEGNVGQSSNSGSYLSREGNMWQAIPPCHNAGNSSLNLSPQLETTLQSEPVNSRLELSMLGLTPYSPHTSGAESSQRNHRLTMNPSNHQDSSSHDPYRPIVIAEPIPPGETLTFASYYHSRESLPHDKPIITAEPNHQDSSSQDPYRPIITVMPNPPPGELSFASFYSREAQPPRPVMSSSQAQPVASNLPSSQRYGPTATVEGVSMSRDDVQIDRQREREINPEFHSGRSAHAQLEMLFEARRRAFRRQNPPDAGLNGGGVGMPRNIGSSSQAASGSSSQSTPVPSWGSSRRHQSSAQYSRRLTEYVRRSMLSPPGSEIGGPAAGSSSSSTHRSVPFSSQEVVLPSGGGSHGHNQPLPRSHPSVDRHGAGVNGIPHSSRTLPGADEGRIRLVSEQVQQIRNVIDMMRRGEGLRFEDVMVLDPSVLFGMADINDQHRDMRLDVDNMSYEELLALEDRIGSVCTGITAETVAARLKRRKYFAIARSDRAEVEPCCVCQEEYNNGDDLGTLDCGHDFHTECIKQWLGQKNQCPICKTTGLAT